MAEFRMPSLGADMESGTLIAWHVAAGDQVAKGDIVAEVDTDKSVIDVETFATGTVEALLVEEGERVPVGTPLAVIRELGAPAQSALPPVPAGTAPPAAPTSTAPPATPTGTARPTPVRRHPAASPLARRHAAMLGVDLAEVTGTGPGGAVTTTDVDRFAARSSPRPDAAAATPPPDIEAATPPPDIEAAAPPHSTAAAAPPHSTAAAAPPPSSSDQHPAAPSRTGPERQAALRRAIATSMARSKREIPHYYLACDIDMARAESWLADRNSALPVTERLLPVVLLLKATALALHETPDLHGFWEDDAYHPPDGVHLGVAIALRGGGLVAPALTDADRRTLTDLMTGLRGLVARARAGNLRSSEVSQATITVTSLGDQGVDVVQPVIYPPQVAIVGFGRIRERPWAVGGMLGARPVVTATLAADHRVSDGHRGAIFLTALDHLLQSPEDL